MSTGGCPQVVAKKVELLKDFLKGNPSEKYFINNIFQKIKKNDLINI